MLHHAKNICIAFIVVFIFSCGNKEHTDVKTQLYKSFAMKFANNDNYCKVYNSLNDSVKNWRLHKLPNYNEDTTQVEYIFDSLLCFNRQCDKFVAARLCRDFSTEENTMEGVVFYYGVKIKEQWYFFSGATCYLPRKNYTKDIHTPLSFAKLHEIAMKEVFGGYLVEKQVKKDMGWWKNIFAPEYNYSYEINDTWFDYHFKTSWGYYKNDKFITPSTQREWDSLYIDKALSVWRK